MMDSLVSVIVTTKNSGNTLESCLLSVKNQSYKHIELIVIDNNSTDQTNEITQRYTNNMYQKGPERSAQRNLGIEKSKGEFLLFLDSDMILSPKVVEECVQKIDGYVGLYIPEIVIGNTFWATIRTFERSFYNETVIDAVRFIPKNLADKINGFDEKLFAGEDWDFNIRINQLGKTRSINSALFHDETNTNVKNYLSKKSYYSANLKVYKNKWKNHPDVEKQFNPFYRLWGIFVENGRWKKILAHPFLFLCVIVLKFSVGLQFLFNTYGTKK